MTTITLTLPSAHIDCLETVPVPVSKAFSTMFRLRIYRLTANRTLVIATEMMENEGPSVTNCVETLIEFVYRKYEIEKSNMFWVEHYGPESYQFSKDASEEDKAHRFSQVFTTGSSNSAYSWRYLSIETILGILSEGVTQ